MDVSDFRRFRIVSASKTFGVSILCSLMATSPVSSLSCGLERERDKDLGKLDGVRLWGVRGGKCNWGGVRRWRAEADNGVRTGG